MADNKASALKDAESNIKLKIYYSGTTPAESGVKELEYNLEPLGENHFPWLFKYYPNKDLKGCAQFVSSRAAYQNISKGLAEILDAVIVNTKQRDALDKLVDHLLWEKLCDDNANEGDGILYV